MPPKKRVEKKLAQSRSKHTTQTLDPDPNLDPIVKYRAFQLEAAYYSLQSDYETTLNSNIDYSFVTAERDDLHASLHTEDINLPLENENDLISRRNNSTLNTCPENPSLNELMNMCLQHDQQQKMFQIPLKKLNDHSQTIQLVFKTEKQNTITSRPPLLLPPPSTVLCSDIPQCDPPCDGSTCQ